MRIIRLASAGFIEARLLVEFNSAHSRHLDIADNQIPLTLLGRRKGFDPIVDVNHGAFSGLSRLLRS